MIVRRTRRDETVQLIPCDDLTLAAMHAGVVEAKAGASLTPIMSGECGYLTHRPCNTLAVVPAKAGTHSHKRCLLRDAGTTSPAKNASHGVWVPAFAGTTRIMRRTRRDETVQLIPCDDLTLAAMHAGVVEAKAGASLTLKHVARMRISDSPAVQHTRCRPCESTRASTCLPESSQRLSLATQRNAALLLSSAREMASSSGKQVLDRESLFGPEKMCRCPSAKAGTHNTQTLFVARCWNDESRQQRQPRRMGPCFRGDDR